MAVPTQQVNEPVVICTEDRSDTAVVYGLKVQNPDHEMVRPIAECAGCVTQPACEAYGRAIRREKSG